MISLINTTDWFSTSALPCVFRAAEIRNPQSWIGPTLVWISGMAPSGSLRTIILDASRCEDEAIELSVTSVEGLDVMVSSVTLESHVEITRSQVADVFEKLTLAAVNTKL